MAHIKQISGVDDRVELAEVLPLKSPFTLNVFPTNACNFKCVYCAHSLDDATILKEHGLDKSFMSMDTMRKIVEQSKVFEPYKLLSFNGHGEPLLNRDLPDMIALANKANIARRIEIISNASLLKREYADRLIESGLTNLRVSLQGLNAESYKKTSGVDVDFDKFLAQLEYFHKNKRPEMGLFVKIMDVSLSDGDKQRFYEMFDGISDRMYIEYVQPVYHTVELSSDQSNSDVQRKYDRYGNAHTARVVCPLAFFTLNVWPNGDYDLCDAPYKPCALGNISQLTMREMWDGETLRNFRYRLLCGERYTLEGCKNCVAPDDCSQPLDVLDNYVEQLKPFYA
ncbi:MAG: radical SAM protein [Synergistaceae bacterium]|jgi:MoaA/NifB/PqqE/SkfB family radical SAM enzyme|nr:radical SAM protein [Synergistaceae bacterium]